MLHWHQITETTHSAISRLALRHPDKPFAIIAHKRAGPVRYYITLSGTNNYRLIKQTNHLTASLQMSHLPYHMLRNAALHLRTHRALLHQLTAYLHRPG